MNYFENKQENKKKARIHNEAMEKMYPNRISNAVKDSVIYGVDAETPKPIHEGKPEIVFMNTDSVEALLAYGEAEGKKCVLNFASFRNPGGMFMEGSSAQEESLCHQSFLYNVLRRFPDYYAWNEKNKNRGMYENRAIYTPGVVFAKGERSTICDVLTCAAPNFSAGKRYGSVPKSDNSAALRSRIRFVLDIAETEHVDTFITGAFGCGVFSQDASEVAELFKMFIANTSIRTIVFAVPGNDKNAKAFSFYFGRHGK